MSGTAKDEFTRQWILDHGVPIVEDYDGDLTIRSLYYRLVALGMTNSIQHYKRVVAAMKKARWERMLEFDAFHDYEREVIGDTPYEVTCVEEEAADAEYAIRYWMDHYKKNRWENQPRYVEVFIEKKALRGVFEQPCKQHQVSLSPCKGYPSITFLYEAANRLKAAQYEGKECIVLYFGDYDPSGEDIPRSIGETLDKFGASAEIQRVLLLDHQVEEWGLPHAPTKMTDSRSKNWDGVGQVELDAVEPRKMRQLISEAISEHFNTELHEELLAQEEEEREEYRDRLRSFVTEM